MSIISYLFTCYVYLKIKSAVNFKKPFFFLMYHKFQPSVNSWFGSPRSLSLNQPNKNKLHNIIVCLILTANFCCSCSYESRRVRWYVKLAIKPFVRDFGNPFLKKKYHRYLFIKYPSQPVVFF